MTEIPSNQYNTYYTVVVPSGSTTTITMSGDSVIRSTFTKMHSSGTGNYTATMQLNCHDPYLDHRLAQFAMSLGLIVMRLSLYLSVKVVIPLKRRTVSIKDSFKWVLMNVRRTVTHLLHMGRQKPPTDTFERPEAIGRLGRANREK